LYGDSTVIRTLFFTAMLLLPILAYGANPSADLSVQVVPAGSSGGLPGSILPPGTWVNDLDEHFSGTSINTNIWNVGINNQPGAGGVSNCQVAGTLVVNNGLTLSPLPNLSDGTANGCSVYTNKIWGTPGYYETRLQTDRGNNVWNGMFFEFGNNGDCAGDFAQNGGEVDLIEAFTAGTGQNSIVYNGYGSCQTVNVFNRTPSADAYHVWGMDYGDNGALTWYKDGIQIAQFKPSDGVEPPSCSGLSNCANGGWEGQIILMDFSWMNATLSNPSGMNVSWVRHYHH
jgi:hypothetical protein